MSGTTSGSQSLQDDDDLDFWWSSDGERARWAFFGGIVALLILLVVIGHFLAKRRIRRGLPPSAWNRWLLSREQRAQFNPNYRNPVPDYVYRPEQYGMYAFPPPVYDPNSQPPPSYQPPNESSKVNPTQWMPEPSRSQTTTGDAAAEYAPPVGPPPAAALRPNQTGTSSTSNNPYRL